MSRIITIICIFAYSMNCFSQKSSHTVKKMHFEWKFLIEELEISLSAPTKGWVAVGFNNSDQLKGTNLIMCCVKNGKTLIEDHYIIRSGLHEKVENLGGINRTTIISGKESSSRTSVTLRLQLLADQHHPELSAGLTYYVLLAYSISDDFDHHSIMRTTVPITL